ncbi:hypothetical protein [Candidatus Zinderia endosymbiont of Aphrophora alni]|uniref:hypothetical protein n=1 Tax=Candidatus Zinderia endosymbiont of Aphrophora alni TaxID=3077951 RepID=UPI0030D2CBD6
MLFPWFKKFWKKINYLRNKLPNVILFYGNYGIGKVNFVQYFAKSLLCENFFSKKKICNKKEFCISCFWFNKNIHPDYFSILPEVINKNEKSIYLNKLLLNKLNINQIKLLIKFTYFTNSLCNLKVILLSDIESLNIFSANSLLKILEEPPKKVIFLLIANNLKKILPTILSRCYKIILRKPSYEESLFWLKKKSLKNIEELFFNSGGFPILALKYFYKNYYFFLKKFFSFLFYPKNVDINNLSKYLLKIDIKSLLLILQLWLYDLFFLKTTNNIYYFFHFKKKLLFLVQKTTILKINFLLKKINNEILLYSEFLSSYLFIESLLIEYQLIFFNF